MRLLKFLIGFFNRGNKIVRRVIGIHIFVVLSFYFFDFFANLFKPKETVYTVQLVSTAPASDSSGSQSAPSNPEPATPKPPVKKIEPSKPKQVKPPKPKPVAVKPKPKVTAKPKPVAAKPKPKANPKPKRTVRTAEEIRREMFKNMKKPTQAKKPIKEYKFDSNRLKSSLNKAVQGVRIGKSSSSSASSSNYNYSSYNSKLISALYNLWSQPNLGRKLMVTVKLTISKNGRVTAKRVVKKSGNTIMDNSINAMLAKLSTLPPLPSTTPDSQLTQEVTFVLDN